MEIKTQFKNYVLAISIGHKTDWFDQTPFILVSKETFYNKEVVYAEYVWGFPW